MKFLSGNFVLKLDWKDEKVGNRPVLIYYWLNKNDEELKFGDIADMTVWECRNLSIG